MSELVLASGSPRRAELLATLGLAFEIVVPDVDETPRPGEDPRRLVARLAEAKVRAVAAPLALAADTEVALDDLVLGKPVDAAAARRMLTALSGREHLVHTGVALRRHAAVDVEVVTTAVRFVPLDAATIDRYIATGEPYDKAGGYAIQGRAGAFVESITGSPSNVIGLPLATVARMLGDLTVGHG